MIEVRLVYDGDGRFSCATRFDLELVERKIARNAKVRARLTKPKSADQNALFHALIQAAWENQRTGPVLPTWRHLKSWLLIRIGHCVTTEVAATAMTKEMAQFLRGHFETIDFTTDGRAIFVKIAKPIAPTDADELSRIINHVADVICSDICPGLSPNDLLTESRKSVS